MKIPIHLIRTPQLVEYLDAMAFMEQYVEDIIAKKNVHGCVWFLEHPPIITGGTSAQSAEILKSSNIPIYETEGENIHIMVLVNASYISC
jgi:lipoyl(octanoyl) transferase